MGSRPGAAAKVAGALCVVAATAGATWGVTHAWSNTLFLVPLAIVPVVITAMAGLLGLLLVGLRLLGPPFWRTASAPAPERPPRVVRRVIVLPNGQGSELAPNASSRSGSSGRFH